MADRTKRLDTNIEGNFYVDSTCINCDTCRQLAPKTFEEVGEFSSVLRQPDGGQQLHQAYQALLACPVGSIGTDHSDQRMLQDAKAGFPMPLEGGVSYCGFNSEKSFGANSFFVEHPDGNWLIDSPRYITQLVECFEQRGGIRYIFLSHEDDVADSDRYAKQFGAVRIIHQADAEAGPGAERIIEGEQTIQLAPRFQAIPVPGHTPGSMALLYDERFLFTGDHLWWNPESKTLGAPQRLVWRERALVASIEKLLAYRFEWVLPGHGNRIRLPATEMNAAVQELIRRRRATKLSRTRSLRSLPPQ
jgi:glyoxylase-like metal-dependent hydrolase (beta-lactamase superfamily II)/ferredoxin